MLLSLSATLALADFGNWLTGQAAASPVLGGFGLAVLVALALLVLLMAARGLTRMISRFGWRASARRIRRQRRPGYLIVAAPFHGPRAHRARAFTLAALKTHLAAFSFNAPFELHAPDHRPDHRLDAQDPLAGARAMMLDTEADIVLFGADSGSSTKPGITLQGLARTPGGSAADATAFTIAIPGDIADRGADMARLLAYAVCRELQPALARPQDFRADKLEPIARRVGALLAAQRDAPATLVVRRLQDDHAAAALHLGEAKKDGAWLETAAKAYEAIIAQGRAGDADRWVTAKLGLGRAMLALAELRFDPVRVQEGTAHIRAALEVLRGHAKLRAADQGIAALQKAERMMENRRRFSITWPV